jgi:hypothetical protein
MKTFPITTILLAALATVATTSAASADDAGVVRLGRRASTSASTGAADGGVVVRGQSGFCPLGAPEPQGFLQRVSRKLKPSSPGTNSCDGGDGVLRGDACVCAAAPCDGCAVSAGAACDARDGCTNIPGGKACETCAPAPGCHCESCACCDCSPDCNCES